MTAWLAPDPKRTRIKMCGLSTPETVATAVEAGADLIGFVMFPKSPRHVSLAAAAALAAPARGRVGLVLLTVDPDDTLLDAALTTCAPDVLQLHGHETPERVAAIRARFGVPVLKAVSVATAADVAAAAAYRNVADLVLFDAKPPQAAGALPGGNGLVFDWQLLIGVAERFPFMLSGGLAPQTVAHALAVTRAAFVDVSSGVETAPGQKSPALIRAFIAAVGAANRELSGERS